MKPDSIKKSKGDLSDSDGLAKSCESVFSKAHWDKIVGKAKNEKEVLDKLAVKADKRSKK